MIEAEGRNLAPAELAGGNQPAMAGDDLVAAIDQDRNIKTEGFDAGGDLPDLLLAVAPWVGCVGLKLVDAAIDYP